MKVLAIAGTDLRRLMRWRANVFFLFVLPMLIILLLGAAFGGSNRARIGVVGGDRGELARQFVGALEARPSTELHAYADREELERAVARGRLDAGLLIPSDYDARMAAGRPASLGYLGRPDSVAQQLRATVQSVAAEQAQVLVVAGLIERAEPMGCRRALARARGGRRHAAGARARQRCRRERLRRPPRAASRRGRAPSCCCSSSSPRSTARSG